MQIPTQSPVTGPNNRTDAHSNDRTGAGPNNCCIFQQKHHGVFSYPDCQESWFKDRMVFWAALALDLLFRVLHSFMLMARGSLRRRPLKRHSHCLSYHTQQCFWSLSCPVCHRYSWDIIRCVLAPIYEGLSIHLSIYRWRVFFLYSKAHVFNFQDW